MVVNTTWSNPATAGGSGGTDLSAGDTLSETVWDRVQSNLNRLGGADGNSKTGPLRLNATSSPNNLSGLTVEMIGGGNDEFVTLSDATEIGHGMTAITATSTFAMFKKFTDSEGGLNVVGLTEATTGLLLQGYHATDDTAKTTSARGALHVIGALKSGASAAALGANANIIAFANSATTRFILDGDGDSHQDIGTAWTNFHGYDDIALLNTLSAHLTRKDDPLRSAFTKWLEQSREPLEKARIVTFNEDGHHFINWSRTHMLEIGAILQLGERLTQMEARLALLPSPRD